MKAWELLSKPGAWTQGTLARDWFGHRVDPTHPTAKSWCVIGAIYHCYPPEEAHALRIQYDYALVPWNDTFGRTQAEVVDRLAKLNL